MSEASATDDYAKLRTRYDHLMRKYADLQVRVDMAVAGLRRHDQKADKAELHYAIRTLTGATR